MIRNRNEKEIVIDQYEDNENDYINSNDFFSPKPYNGRNNNIEILR